jgi:hypothetical protein
MTNKHNTMSKFTTTAFDGRLYAIHAIQYVAAVNMLEICKYEAQYYLRFGEPVSEDRKTEFKTRVAEINALKSFLDSIPADGMFGLQVDAAEKKAAPVLEAIGEILKED